MDMSQPLPVCLASVQISEKGLCKRQHGVRARGHFPPALRREATPKNSAGSLGQPLICPMVAPGPCAMPLPNTNTSNCARKRGKMAGHLPWCRTVGGGDGAGPLWVCGPMPAAPWGLTRLVAGTMLNQLQPLHATELGELTGAGL